MYTLQMLDWQNCITYIDIDMLQHSMDLCTTQLLELLLLMPLTTFQFFSECLQQFTAPMESSVHPIFFLCCLFCGSKLFNNFTKQVICLLDGTGWYIIVLFSFHNIMEICCYQGRASLFQQ